MMIQGPQHTLGKLRIYVVFGLAIVSIWAFFASSDMQCQNCGVIEHEVENQSLLQMESPWMGRKVLSGDSDRGGRDPPNPPDEGSKPGAAVPPPAE